MALSSLIERSKLLTATGPAKRLLIAMAMIPSGCDQAPSASIKEAPSNSTNPAAQAAKPTPSPFAAFPCPAGGAQLDAKQRGAALHIAQAVDYASVRWMAADTAESLGEVGEPCAGAKDRPACQQKLAEAIKSTELGKKKCTEQQICEELVYAVVTTKDDVRMLRAGEDFQQLLAPIKSVEAAWLLAQVKLGASPYLCNSEDFAAQRAIEGGYELRERRYTKRCDPQEKTEFVYRVMSSGAAEVLSRRVVESTPVGCENPTSR